MNSNKTKISEKQIKNFLVCSYGIPTNHPLLSPIVSHIRVLFEDLRKARAGRSTYIEFAWQNYHIVYGITVADLWLGHKPANYQPLDFDKMCRLTTHLHQMILRHK